MADRIIQMRDRLYDNLVSQNTPGEWNHIKKQIGMFRYVLKTWSLYGYETGLTVWLSQLYGPDAAADEGVGGEGAHLHDRGRAHLDGGLEREQH